MMPILPVLIRADGGPGIGLGHVRRSLALAEALRAREVEVTLVVSSHPALRTTVEDAGFAVETVPLADSATLATTRALAQRLQAAAVVLDSYTVSAEALQPPLAPITAMIDDLGDRELPVDLLVRGTSRGARFPSRVSARTTVLTGLPYVILHPEFGDVASHHVRSRVERVLVTLGGEDALGLTPALVRAVARVVPDADVDAVLGPLAPGTLDAATAAVGNRVRVHRPTGSLRRLLEGVDVAVSGGGQTAYELAAMGVPAVAVELADNQRDNLEALESQGTLVVSGRASDDCLGERIERLVQELAADVARRQAMAAAGRRAIDGRGAARVADVLLAKMGATRSRAS